MIEIRNMTKIYNEKKANAKTAVDDVTFSVGDGELVAIVGKSGAGKSTLLKIMAGILRPTGGNYIVDGQSVDEFDEGRRAEFRNRTVGLVTQNAYLINEISVFENIVLPLNLTKMKRNEKKARVDEVMQKLDIADLSKQKVNTLSGGEKQRTAIARAIVNDPAIVLADEPTGALDSENGQNVMEIFTRLNRDGKTVIIVTHDTDLAEQCGRIIELSDGKIISDDLNDRPESRESDL